MQLNGIDGTPADVGADKRLKTNGGSLDEQWMHACDDGRARILSPASANVDATDVALFMKNLESEYDIVIYKAYSQTDAETDLQVNTPTATTTPAGTAVTPANMNSNSAREFEGTFLQDATAPAQGTVISTVRVVANQWMDLGLDGYVLGPNKMLAVDIVEEPGETYNRFLFFYRKR